ncbi:chitin-binding protein [Virgisporangium aliadipatigenens]|uniref:Chitin-binding protein n=1 Tax=Virgisporangium aliadipatigenens TaxID=741659 RepID=A0A8J3YLH5_9ACTN|nr:chitin-binding protein [Virgisporangium aliadipatigenens]
MRRTLKAALSAAVILAATGAVAVLTPSPALAHGAMMAPGSRTYNCWRDGLSNSNGNIVPHNPACSAAVAQGGANPLYNWFSVLRSDGAGRTVGFVPDGSLCSGGNSTFAAYNLARDDWPQTHLTSGASFNWRYSNWAHHPGTFYMYVTKDSWSPTRALAWSDLESTPFLQVTNPPQNGAVGTNDGHYYWTGNLPSGKSGKHIIYSVWSRSDSQETFYGCSDVTFDGGNGEVTGIGPGGNSPGPSSPAPSSPRPSSAAPSSARPSSAAPSSNSPQPGGGCAATFRVTGSWNGGFQGEVTVRNSGTAAIAGWTASYAFGEGQQVTQVWSGKYTQSGTLVTVTNETWNGALNAGQSTTFGLLGNGTAPAAAPVVGCQSR